MLIRPYLRASTSEQNAERAKKSLAEFVHEQNNLNKTNHRIASWYIENASGSSLDRNILNKLLDESGTGDILLIESIDRLTRMCESDWHKLRGLIKEKELWIVSADLPTTHTALQNKNNNAEYIDSILSAVNSMLLDILAATSRKDLIDRKKRQFQGIEIAKGKGKYLGRKANNNLHKAILELSKNSELSINDIAITLNTSKSTVSRVRRKMKPI